MPKYVYRFYSEINYAETSRHPDDIHRKEIACFSTLEKAEKFVLDYIRKYMNIIVDNYNFDIEEDFREWVRKRTEEILPKKIKFDKNNKWHFVKGGSWATFFYLEKIKLI